jgi:ATP-dependent Lon protease
MVGKTMEESINVALSYIKSLKGTFGIEKKAFDKKDVHIHFLEGSVKKDGPSAGIAVVTSILSLLLGKKISKTVGMTGEITLRGDVLKVGGLKEKIIGAYNEGIKKIYIPYENGSDLEELPKEILEYVKIIKVKNYSEIFKALF